MKKVFISLCMLLTGVCASAQQKGDMAVGLNLGAAPCLESGASLTNFGIGAKFQYNVTNPIRLEADVDYWVKSKWVDMLDVTANVHYLFKVGQKLNIYPLAGIGYAHIGGVFSAGDFDDLKDTMQGIGDYLGDNSLYDDFEASLNDVSGGANKFLFNAGVGVEYPLTAKFSIGAEVKYQYMRYFSRMPITVGVTYKF